jgi:hypothetical protein
MSKIILPGSEGEEAGPGGGSGRLSAADAVTLAQVAHWWRFRLARADAADPLESAFGGVDDSGAARTVGLAAAAVVFPRPLAVPPGGVGLWVVALGVADPPTSGQVYSLAALAHFYAGRRGPRCRRRDRRPPAGRARFDRVARRGDRPAAGRHADVADRRRQRADDRLEGGGVSGGKLGMTN